MEIDLFTAKLISRSGEVSFLYPEVSEAEGETRVTLPRDRFLSGDTESVEILTPLTSERAGTEGYMFYPTIANFGFVRTNFTEGREDCSFSSCISASPLGGLCRKKNSVFFYVTGLAADVSIEAACRNGVYALTPLFHLEGDVPEEDLVVRYKLMGEADYSEMARYYRAYQLREKGCVPLAERCKDRPQLREAAESLELRIRMGWKPYPSPFLHQNADNEPPLKVACDIKTVSGLLDRMTEKGVKHAEICLVGWNIGGHDGRYPQILPSDPRYGTVEEMKALIEKGKKLGYQVTCHVATTAAYEVADNFDTYLLGYDKDEQGKIFPMVRGTYRVSGLCGGLPYSLCAHNAYEKYVRPIFPEIRAYGFEGLLYDDVLSFIKPDKCYHPDHPVTRKQAQGYYRKIAQYSRELFGGFQSEGWFDFMNADLDFVLYTTFKDHIDPSVRPIFDEGIPFWQLVFHGIVMSNASSETVNYPIKPEAEHLRFLEWGSRPVLYLYSKYGEKMNWMGDLDLHTDTPEELEKTAEAIRAAYEEYEALKKLQFAFMEQHDRLGEGVYRTTYSDGTVITVDYGNESYRIEPGELLR